jgi:hypothetical protein
MSSNTTSGALALIAATASSPSRAKPAKRTAKIEVSAETLAKLGAKRLAELLFEASENDRVLARQLRMELMRSDPAALAREIDKQIASLARAKSFVDWQKIRDLVKTLDGLRAAIEGPLAEADATLAAERFLAFFALGAPTIERSDDSGGRLKPVFTFAAQDFAKIVASLHPDLQIGWVLKAYAAAEEDGYGLLDGLIDDLLQGLATSTLKSLRLMIEAKVQALPPPGATGDRFDYRRYFHLSALSALADAQGDVDAFIDLTLALGPESGDDLLAADRPDIAAAGL